MSADTMIAALRRGLRTDVPGRAVFYPGFGASELAPASTVPSASERTAVARAWGRSLAGLRSVVAIKGVGLSDAADAVAHVSAAGVRAGIVVVVLDDPELEASQSLFDTRWLEGLAPGLWLSPRSPQEALDVAELAFATSEATGLPVLIRLTGSARRAARSHARPSSPSAWTALVARSIARLGRPAAVTPLVHPSQALEHWGSLQGRVATAQRILDQIAQHAPADATAACALGRRRAPDVPPDGRHADNVRIVDLYEPVLSVVRSAARFVAADLGTFTLDTQRTTDACLCFGMSIAVAAGHAEAGGRSVALIGDAALLHSGIVALLEARFRDDDVCVLVLDNGGSQSTGGERTGSLDLLSPMTGSTSRVELTDPRAPQVVESALAADGLTVVNITVS